MPTVGVIGNNADEMAVVFLRMCQTGGCRVERANLVNMNKNEQTDTVYIVCINENDRLEQVDVLVALNSAPPLSRAAASLGRGAYLVVNADDKSIWSSLTFPLPMVVTFGFNSKACVTASSVTDDVLQVCIQRGFHALSGCPCEPREFPAPYPFGVTAAAVLGAAAAGVLCGTV